jgi:hypothetical protein
MQLDFNFGVGLGIWVGWDHVQIGRLTMGKEKDSYLLMQVMLFFFFFFG